MYFIAVLFARYEIAYFVLAVPAERNWTNEVCNFETGIPLGLEKLEKREGIFQSGESQGI